MLVFHAVLALFCKYELNVIDRHHESISRLRESFLPFLDTLNLKNSLDLESIKCRSISVCSFLLYHHTNASTFTLNHQHKYP